MLCSIFAVVVFELSTFEIPLIIFFTIGPRPHEIKYNHLSSGVSDVVGPLV